MIRYVTGHQNGVIRLWHMELDNQSKLDRRASHRISGSWDVKKFQNFGPGALNEMYKSCITGGPPEYQLVLYKVLNWHEKPVTALSLGNDLKQLCSGDAAGNLISWTLPDDGFKQTPSLEIEVNQPKPYAFCHIALRLYLHETSFPMSEKLHERLSFKSNY